MSHTAEINTTLKEREKTEPPEVAGTLGEPVVQQLSPDQLLVNYNWRTLNDKNIYLHLVLQKSPDSKVGVAHTNFDSEEVRGQGSALWRFAGSQLQAMSDQGNFPIIHEVDTHEFSRHLPMSDPRYHQVTENQFRGVFEPTARHREVKTYTAERL